MIRRKKIIIFGVLTAIMLLTISAVTAMTASTQTTRKESPLFQIRVNRIRDIITNFLQRDRVFYIPTLFLRAETGTQEVLPPCTTDTGYISACVSTGKCCNWN